MIGVTGSGGPPGIGTGSGGPSGCGPAGSCGVSLMSQPYPGDGLTCGLVIGNFSNNNNRSNK